MVRPPWFPATDLSTSAPFRVRQGVEAADEHDLLIHDQQLFVHRSDVHHARDGSLEFRECSGLPPQEGVVFFGDEHPNFDAAGSGSHQHGEKRVQPLPEPRRPEPHGRASILDGLEHLGVVGVLVQELLDYDLVAERVSDLLLEKGERSVGDDRVDAENTCSTHSLEPGLPYRCLDSGKRGAGYGLGQ